MSKPKCALCEQPATKLVRHLRRRDRREINAEAMCDTHVQNEITLAASGLSMVDIDIQALPESAR